MGRIRSVHPEQWTDDQFVTCTPQARLLAIAIRNDADDNGIFEWNPVKLKMRLMPADDVDVGTLLEELLRTKQVMRYEVEGRALGMIRNFQRFQSPRKPTAKYPLPSESLPNGYSIRTTFIRTSAKPVQNRCSTSTEVVLHGEGKGEGKGEGEGIKSLVHSVECSGSNVGEKSSGQAQKNDYPPNFEQVWQAYPKRSGSNPKRGAFKAWTARIKERHTPEVIHAGVLRYTEFLKAEKNIGSKYVKQAVTFFGPEDPPFFLQDWTSEIKAGLRQT
ncbi:MAG: hypothetical protein HQL52_19905 [Magnetococcales bacterium]|nr:hypothetical protein [Magnetococcales bacterium]